MHDVKDYGIVCDLAANPDVVGLAAIHQVIVPLSTTAGASTLIHAPDGALICCKPMFLHLLLF